MKHNKNISSNVPNLRFPEFEGDWKKTTLHSIAGISKGSGISKGQLSLNGLPCILYGELYTKYKSEIITEIISRTDITSSSLIKSKANDVIIPSSGETAIDISTARSVPYNDVLLGGDLNVIRLKNGDGRFLSYQLNGIRKLDIARIAQGVSVVHLYGEQLKHLQVFLPYVIEQQKIATMLSLIDERIAIQSKIIKKLESLIKGIVEGVLTNQSRGLISLKNILTEYVEKTKVNNQHEVLSSTVKGIFSQKEYFSRDIASENNTGYRIISRNCIVLSPQNLWMGNINFNDKYDIGIVSPSYKVFIINDKFDKYFISFLLKTHRALYSYACASEQGASIVRRNLNIDAFNEIAFRVPNSITQQKIGMLLQKTNSKIETERECLTLLNSQKQYLLCNMFT